MFEQFSLESAKTTFLLNQYHIIFSVSLYVFFVAAQLVLRDLSTWIWMRSPWTWSPSLIYTTLFPASPLYTRWQMSVFPPEGLLSGCHCSWFYLTVLLIISCSCSTIIDTLMSNIIWFIIIYYWQNWWSSTQLVDFLAWTCSVSTFHMFSTGFEPGLGRPFQNLNSRLI